MPGWDEVPCPGDGHPGDGTTAGRSPPVRWIRKPAGAAALSGIPKESAWIASDTNIAPSHLLRALPRLIRHIEKSLRGPFLTFKLNDDATVVALPLLLEQLRALGLAKVQALQLPANRRDMQVVALR